MHTFETNSSNVPAFLLKLWNIVEDPACDDIIAWSSSGTSFIIKDGARVSKEILQSYFKHSNLASFVRQLNMYGFRKVISEKSGLTCESGEMEFQHYFFAKGCADLLENIKRKIPNTKGTEQPAQSNEDDPLPDLSSIRDKQKNMNSMLIEMKRENELLWSELTNMRNQNKAQEHVMQKVIQFLVSMVQQRNPNIGLQRNTPCMLPDITSEKETSQVACLIDVLSNTPNLVTVSQDKPLSPLVIHEVIEVEHEAEENSNCSSTEDTLQNSTCSLENENQECENHLNASVNNLNNRSVISEPISILKPLQPSIPALPSDDCPVDEFILGIPLEYINTSSSNAISIPKEPCNNALALSKSLSDTDKSKNLKTPGMVICTSPKKDDSTKLQISKIPSSNLDVCSSVTSDHQRKESKCRAKGSAQIKKDLQQNDSSCKLALPSTSTALKQSALSKNSVSNHLINIEKELNWLQDQISTSSWNVDTDKLLGLFNTHNIPSNETLNGDISVKPSISNIKTEPINFVEVEEDICNNQFLQCLEQDDKSATQSFNGEKAAHGKLLNAVTTDRTAASIGAEYFLSNGSPPKQKNVHHLQTQKLKKAKRQKIK